MRNKCLSAIALAMLALLGACGGGSLTDAPTGPHGGRTYVPAVATPPLEVYQNLGGWKASCYDTLPAGIYQNASMAAWADQIFAEVNAARVANGLAPVLRSSGLDRVEQAHTRDTALRHYFDHLSLEGLTPWQRIDLAELKDFSRLSLGSLAPAKQSAAAVYDNVAENASRGHESAHSIVQGWLNSPSHRTTLLNPKYTHVGTGVYFYDADYEMPVNAFQVFVEEVQPAG